MSELCVVVVSKGSDVPKPDPEPLEELRSIRRWDFEKSVAAELNAGTLEGHYVTPTISVELGTVS